jgi:sugar phosphate isomerase/epimerase
MIGISTSWKSSAVDNGVELFKAIQRLPVPAVELEYRITNEMFQQLRGLLKSSDIMVASIHNFFPLPPILPRSSASGDLFLLSSPDKEEREQAVKWTLHTFECANDMEAGAVVLHCGKIDMEPEMDALYRYLEKGMMQSEEAQEFVSRKIFEREQKKAKHFDALLFSLEKLIRSAERHNILLGLENRAHYHELPGPDEFAIIFNEFTGAPLRYWHDVGHAHLNEALTFSNQKSLLEQYGDQLIGFHYHDVQGRKDHLPPGEGSVDFAALKPYLKEDTIRIMELMAGLDEAEVLKGLEFLRESGLA